MAVAIAAFALTWVDLSPRVESDFFFAADDPQLQASARIGETFPASSQILVRVPADDPDGTAHRQRVTQLGQALGSVDGVTAVRSVTTERVGNSPLWQRLLLTPDGTATNIVLTTDGRAPDVLVPDLEAVLERDPEQDAASTVHMSGVPVIVEFIRRSLRRDLVLFSTAALLVFGLLIGLVYRDPGVLLGTLVTCVLACAITLVLNQVLGLSIGLLTANIVTIVFVLALSHVVFLTANARREGRSAGVRTTLPGSLGAALTTLLGFLSLTLTSARPLRELGWAGAVGTVVAFGVVFVVYPAFVTKGNPTRAEASLDGRRSMWASVPTGWVAAGVGLLALVAATGLGRLDTDPGLLSYFEPGSELREGLERIDRDGGSSTLDIVVRDPGGARLDEARANDRLWAVQDSLEAIPDVGVVLSPPVLLGHARQQPLAGLLPLSTLADILSTDRFDSVGRSVYSADRRQARFQARMHEVERTAPRSEVLSRIRDVVRAAGMEPVTIGGVYDLQRQLGVLIRDSLRVGLLGLLGLFILVGLGVARSLRVALLMVISLTTVPLIVLGTFGHLGVPVDMITSPAANVALALGVDSMIHLVLRVRRLGDWERARAQLTPPILSAAAIVCLGFGIFAFSAFPPTARFGLAVILGTITAAAAALLVLPSLAVRLRSR